MKFLPIITPLLLASAVCVQAAETNRIAEVAAEEGRSWIAAPLVVMNPAFGNGGGAVGMYFFRPDPTDTVSPASTAGLVGLYSDTDSYFAGLFAKAFLKEDLWRVAGGAVNGRINNEFEISGFNQTVEFSTLVNAAFTRIDRCMIGNWLYGSCRMINATAVP